MPEISYSIVQNANLKKTPLYLEQIEAIIDIGGEKPDPLTLQQIRDEPSLKDCYASRSKNINELIVKYAEAIKTAADEKTAQALVKAFNVKLKAETDRLQQELQTRSDAFVLKQKKAVNDLFWARARLLCRVVYSAAKLLKSGGEAFAKVAAVVAGPGAFIGVVAIKSLVSAGADLKGAYDEIVSAMEGERSQHKKVLDAVKALKAIKAPKLVPKGDVEKLEAMLGPYGVRMMAVDAAAKQAATTLDKFLTQLDKSKFRDEGAKQQIEKLVDKTIHEIIELSKNANEGRKLLQSARSKIVDVSKRIKEDPKSWWDYTGPLWKAFDYVFDMTESTLETSDLKSAFNACHAVFTDKIKDELKDAMAEEHLKA